jgi:hypothetical protein
MSAILALETKMRRGERATEADLSLARTHLGSLTLKERLIAYEFMLYSADVSERLQTIPLVERECAQALDLKRDYHPNFLLVLRRIPWTTVESSSVFQSFIISAAKEGNTASRMNSMLLLGKLAKGGNLAAMEALTSSLADADTRVRANAEWSMGKIRGSGTQSPE